MSILVLRTKIILSAVLFLFRPFCLSSFFLPTSTLVHLSLSLHLSLIFYVLALVMREAGTQELKFSCKRSCLVKIVLYIKNDFLKKKMTLLWIKYLTVVECWANWNMNECLIVCLFLSVCVCVGENVLCCLTIWHVDTTLRRPFGLFIVFFWAQKGTNDCLLYLQETKQKPKYSNKVYICSTHSHKRKEKLFKQFKVGIQRFCFSCGLIWEDVRN